MGFMMRVVNTYKALIDWGVELPSHAHYRAVVQRLSDWSGEFATLAIRRGLTKKQRPTKEEVADLCQVVDMEARRQGGATGAVHRVAEEKRELEMVRATRGHEH